MLLSCALWWCMNSIDQFNSRKIRVVLTDIDGTLTDHGRLPESSYSSMWELSRSGLAIVPVTGRPAGWCEMIARLWPVHGVVGENGAFYFSHTQGKMRRYFARPKDERKKDRLRLKEIRKQVLQEIPGVGIASDQFCRLFDLAIDFSEDVPPLSATAIQKIVHVFEEHGAHAKVSNIHVNGWFGDYDKLTTCKKYLEREFEMDSVRMQEECLFVGDSPNDEPMFEYFKNSFAVANIHSFLSQLKHRPAFIAKAEEGAGFCELADRLLVLQSR